MYFYDKEQNHPLVIRRTIVGQKFDIIVLDWFKMYKETRKAIFAYAICDDNEKPDTSRECTATIVIPRDSDGRLQFNNCRLHISTIGRIDPSDISGFINQYLDGNANRLENLVTLSGSEKVMVLCSLIPTIDMREVI